MASKELEKTMTTLEVADRILEIRASITKLAVDLIEAGYEDVAFEIIRGKDSCRKAHARLHNYKGVYDE